MLNLSYHITLFTLRLLPGKHKKDMKSTSVEKVMNEQDKNCM